MSKLGKFAAACAAVLCAFGLQAATTYVWSGAGTPDASGAYVWCDAANWSVNNQPATAYPGEQATDDAVKFGADLTAKIRVDGALTLGWINANSGNQALTFVGADGEAALSVAGINPGLAGKSSTLTFDGLALKVPNGVTVAADTMVRFVNGASFVSTAAGNCNFILFNSNSALELASGSTFTSDQHAICLGADAQLIVDDARIRTQTLYFNYPQTVNAAKVFLRGQHPVFEVTTYLQSNNNGNCKGTTEFVFEVPEGGYEEPPLQGRNIKLFDAGNAPAGGAVLTVSADSPALTAGTRTSTLLAYGSRGANRAKSAQTEGANVTFAWQTSDATTAAADDASAIFLRATVGSGSPAEDNVKVSRISSFLTAGVSARTLTLTAKVLALASGRTTRLSAYVGESEDKASHASAGVPVDVTAYGNAQIVWMAPEFEHDYWCYLRCETLNAAGEVIGVSETDAVKVHTVDNATYTWIGGTEGNWDDPANWSNDKGGDCLGYPQSTSSPAKFYPNTVAKVHLRRSAAANLSLAYRNQDITFDAQGAAEPVTLTTTVLFDPYGANFLGSHLTVDGLSLVSGNSPMKLQTSSVITLRNGACLSFGNTDIQTAGRIEVLSGSTLHCTSHLKLGGGFTIVLDDGLLQTDYIFDLGKGTPGGCIEFRGAQPRFLVNSKDQEFKSVLANAGTSFEFYLPEGGYAEAPIQCVSTRTVACGAGTSSTFGIGVHATRAAIVALSGQTVPLIAWSAGIVKDSFAFRADDTDFSAVWSEEGNPLTLGVSVAASDHASRLTVSGAPIPFAGGISPDYGTYEATAALVCTAPSGAVTVDGLSATCTGYRLFTVDPATGEKSEAAGSPFAATSYTYQPNSGWTELEWQWTIDRPAPSVTAAGRTFAPKTARVAYGTPIEYELPADVTQAEIQGMVDQAPEGSVITLADGQYDFTSTLNVTRAVTLRGSSFSNCIFNATAKFNRLLSINNSQALVCGVTISNAVANVAYNWEPAGVLVTSGTLAQSRVTCCKAESANLVGGIATKGSGARVTRCLIDHNTALQGGGHGGGVNLYSGGLVDNCLIVGNSAQAGGGVVASSGRLVNCTIVNNTATTAKGGGVWLYGQYNGGALVANCIIRDNVAPYDGSVGAPDIGDSAYPVGNCASGTGFGNGGVSADPQFADAPGGDWTLLISSPCLNRGDCAVLPDGAAGLDFAGNPRVTGSSVDMGCYEYDTSAVACAFAADKEQTHLGNTVVLTASVSGFDDADDLEYGWRVTREGASDPAVASVNPYPFTATEPGRYDVTLTVSSATLGKSLSKSAAAFFYVAPLTNFVTSVKGALAAFPYGSAESAATNLADAIAAAIPGSVVSLDRGQHDVGAALFVDKAIEVIGAGMTNTVLYMTKSFSPAVTLNHKDAVFRRLTIAHARKASSDIAYQGVGVMIAAGGGTLDRCRVTDCSNNGCYYTRGGGVYMVGNGRITRCLIDGNVCSGPNCDSGGIYMSSGLVDNSLIVGNSCTFFQYGGAGIAANGGKVVSCTITGNAITGGAGGGVWKNDGAVLANCILADNVANDDGSDPAVTGKPDLGNSTANVYNCRLENPIGVSPVVAPAGFADAKNGDYRLTGASKCLNAGDNAKYLELVGATGFEDETDLDENPRLSGATIDLGCYERDALRFDVSFAVDATVAFKGTAFAFTPTVSGADDPDEAVLTWTLTPSEGGEAIVETQTGTNVFSVAPSGYGYYDVSLDATVAGRVAPPFEQKGLILVAAYTNYVTAAENPDSRYPYATPETAATVLNDAVAAAVAGAVVLVGEGTNAVRQTVQVDKDISVVGLGRDRTIVRADTAFNKVIYINSRNARVENLTVAHGRIKEAWSDSGEGVVIGANGGTLADCRVTDCTVNGGWSMFGAVYLGGDAAVVTRCLIDGNSVQGQSGHSTCGGVFVMKGRLENSIVSNNVGAVRADDKGSGVVVRGGATVLNCTIVGNGFYKDGDVGGGICAYAKSTVRNCVIEGNVLSDGTSRDYQGTATAFSNCLSPEAAPEGSAGCVIGRPVYREGTFVLTADSPGRNKGSVAGYEDILFDGTDFYGKRRVKSPRRSAKAKIDIGCAESDPDGLLLLVK